jgi:hypothetical protein
VTGRKLRDIFGKESWDSTNTREERRKDDLVIILFFTTTTKKQGTNAERISSGPSLYFGYFGVASRRRRIDGYNHEGVFPTEVPAEEMNITTEMVEEG